MTTLASAVITVSDCAGGAAGAAQTFTLSSGLRHLGNGNYQIDWKTPKSYARSCKVLYLDLGHGLKPQATFNFTK